VKFHHGKEFKAEDVLFTMNRIRDPEADNPNSALLVSVVDIVAVDDYTVRFDLNGPNGFFLDAFSIYPMHILPADVDVDRLTLEAFGTGPFTLEEWLPGERATMVKNPDYWEEGRPYLDEIVFVGISEPATRAEALKSGDVDVVYLLETQSVQGIEDHPDTKVVSVASAGHYGIDMDNSRPPFDNKLVRKAFQAATDRELINQATTLGLGSITYDHPFPSNDSRFAPQYAVEYDPELAKSLLEQAGYPDGIDIILHTGDVAPGMIEMAVAFQESAAPAGIRVEVKKHPPDSFWSEVFMQNPLVIIQWAPRPSMDVILTQKYHSDSAWNSMRYYNDTLDGLIARAKGETLEQQKETYGEIQRILADDVPGLVIANQPLIYGVRNYVQDAGPTPVRARTLRNAWLEK
jgi:peptide/nickel transport system substrate-binding protein